MLHDPIPEKDEWIGQQIVDAAFSVHAALGPGLLESIYETCFCYELNKRGLTLKRQVVLPIHYDGIILDDGLRLDVLVEDRVICELKAVEIMHPVFTAQLLSYLKLTNLRLGYLVNFNVPIIKSGIKRLVL